MTNLVTGVAEAFQSSVPMLALVGQPMASVEGRGAFQDSSGVGRTTNAVQLFASISKYTRRVDNPETFWEFFEEAVVEARRGRPGPSVLLFPRSIYTAEVPDRVAAFAASVAERVRPQPPDPILLRAALDQLRMARRPMLLVGQGAQRTANSSILLEFATALNIPVATTMGARGEFPNDHPNYLGVLGVAGHPSAHAFVRDECDLLFLAGASLNTMTRAPFARDPVDLPQKTLVAVSVDLGELRRIVGGSADKVTPGPEVTNKLRSWWPKAVNDIAVGIEADLGATLEALLELWKDAPFRVKPLSNYEPQEFVSSVSMEIVPPRSAEPPRSVRSFTFDDDLPSTAVTYATTLKEVLETPRPREVADEPILRSEALTCLSTRLPSSGGTITFDAGNCAAAALHTLPIPRGVTSLIALGVGGMGFAAPGAIGAQLGAAPGTRSICIIGDGGFLMLGLEIHTAVDLRLPVLFVVFNNNMHGMCATRQQLFFESRYEAVSYAPLNIAQTARGLGSEDTLWVARATTLHELENALDDFDYDPSRTGVLEIVLGAAEVPPFTPFLPKEAPTKRGLLSVPPRPPNSENGRGPRSRR